MLRLTLIYLLCIILFTTNCNAWKLIWEDHFDGTQLNASNWNIANNFYHDGNQELQLYVKDEVYLSGGNLHLRSSHRYVCSPWPTKALHFVTYRSYKGYNYTSGWIDTLKKFSVTYGRIEIRAKLPGGKGLWPAHWMLPEDLSCWPTEGEIDIMVFCIQPSAYRVH